jgi:precorrin-2/cobalt-factor-2 C20-methyltransferase
MTGRTLVGVGMGPGDPELVTVKAVRVLREADLVLVPVMATGEPGRGAVSKERDPGQAGGSGAVAPPGRAEATVRAHVTHDRVARVAFALTEGAGMAEREAAWDGAAAAAVAAFDRGASVVAFATIGDPNVYSTFTYLAATVRARVPGLTVATVPGITAMQDLAARSGTVLCEGRETLALLPLTSGLVSFKEALARFDTVVGYKSGRHLPEVLAAVRDAGRMDGAVHGASLGLPGEDIRPAADVTGPAPYLSTLLVPGLRTRRGGKL